MFSKCAVEQNTPSQVGNGGLEENWVDPGGMLNKSGRGGRGGRGRGISGPRGRGVRPQRKRTSSRFGSSREVPVVANGEKSRQAPARGRSQTRRGRRRGQRSGRNRQKAMKKTAADSKARYLEKEEMVEASRVQGEDNLTCDVENRELPFEEDENDSSSERSDFEYEDGRTARSRYRVAGEDDAEDLGRKSDDLLGGSRYKEDDEYEDNDSDDNGEEDDEDDDGYVNLHMNEESDTDDLRDDDGFGFRKLDPDEGLGSTPSESSD